MTRVTVRRLELLLYAGVIIAAYVLFLSYGDWK